MKTFYFTTMIAAFLFFGNNGIPAQTVKTGSLEKVEFHKVSKDLITESKGMLQTNKATMTSGFGLGSMGGYYTFSEVVAQLDSMRKKHPNLITAKDSIGTSIEGRTIWAVKISDNPDIKENEPEVFYNALSVSDQPLGMMTVMYFMVHLLENYGTDPEVTYLVNNRELYFVPVINPDGYVYNEKMSPKGGGTWGKNRRNNGETFGVNLIRNYSYKWGNDNIGSSPNPQDRGYRGTAPFSEPETQAVRDFCLSHNFVICNTYFGYGETVYPPWAYVQNQTPDAPKFNRLIKIATAINGYANGYFLPPTEFGLANGTSQDWMYGETNGKNKIFALDILVGNYIDGAWPKPERIIPLAEENLYLSKVFAWGPGIIENLPYISDGNINPTYCNPKVDTLKFKAIEQNPDNSASKVYAQVINSKDSVVSETLLAKTDSTFTGYLISSALSEDYYTVKYRQNGTDIPSNLYYTDVTKLKFTTVGPVVLDDIILEKASTYFTAQPFLRNESASFTIKKPSVKLICTDPWALPISQNLKSLPEIVHGKTATTQYPFQVKYIDSLFQKHFNFKVEISSDGYVYWTDTLKKATGIEKDLQQNAFYLEQNYPNPFNSITTINWQIAENSKVTLKVLDIVGRTVVTLVDEQRPRRKYETQFNAATLPKGIYLCQLKAGEFSQTRKMILIE
jgi:hypothetical protein